MSKFSIREFFFIVRERDIIRERIRAGEKTQGKQRDREKDGGIGR